MSKKKIRDLDTILKHSDIQVIDIIEDILTDLDINNSYISLLDEYIQKSEIKDNNDISDKDKLTLYFLDKERNKQSYINLLDDIRARNEKTKEELRQIRLYLSEDIPLEALNKYKED